MSIHIENLEEQEIGKSLVSEFGFVYAFFLYSHSNHNSIIEKMVSLVTRSDYIHVAIIPAVLHSDNYLDTKRKKKRKIEVIDKVYTAFMGEGYKIQTVDKVLNDSYKFFFYPAESLDFFYKSWAFLENLHGAKYNYLSCMLALFPKTFKEMDNSESQLILGKNEKVICSELALFILYYSDSSLKPTLNPRYCTPGELHEILSKNKKSSEINSDVFEVLSPETFMKNFQYNALVSVENIA
jgi:hypothetical protein